MRETEAARPTLLHVFPTFDVGGSQVRLAQIANHFGPRCRHWVMSLNGGTSCAGRFGPEVDFRLLPAPPKRRLPASLPDCRRMLVELLPDTLVTYNWGAMDWALANWPRLVRHVHIEDGFGPEETEHQIARRVWTRRLALRRSLVVLPSFTLADLARKVWRLPKRRHIPNGIDCARYAATDGTGLPPLPGAGPVIGTIATLRPEKRLDRLLHAFRKVTEGRPARLVVVGDGPERPRLERMAGELDLADRVTFTGPRPDPARVIGGFDAMALSSDTEQMPYAVLEAMAAGLPVVATDVGDIRRMVAPENDPLLCPRDDDALARALATLLDQPPLGPRIGAANRAKARTCFDQAAMFASYADVFALPDPEVP